MKMLITTLKEATTSILGRKQGFGKFITYIGIFLFLSLLTYFFIFKGDYYYGIGNQGELIPIHNRFDDSSYLANDDYVNKLQEYNVRTNFALVMYVVKNVTPHFIDYPEVYLIFHILITFFSFTAIYLISSFFAKQGIQRLALTALIIITPFETIGSAMFLHKMLLPSSFAVLFMLWAFYFLWKRNYYLCLFMIALAIYFHILMGVLFSMVFCSTILILNGKKNIKKSIILFALFTITILPAFLPLIRSILLTNVDSERVSYIIGFFRNPHHYIPSTWNVGKILYFFFLQFIAIIFLFTPSIRKRPHIFYSLLLIFLMIGILFFVGYFFVEIVTIPFIVKLQLFRISIINVFICRLIYFASGIDILHFVLKKMRCQQKTMRAVTNMIIFLVVMYYAYNFFSHYKNDLDYEFSQPKNGKTGPYTWIRENTAEDSIILTSIDEDNIRLQTERAVVVTFKQFVFNDTHVIGWYDRIKDLCGMEDPQCSGWDCRSYCREKFYSYTEEDLLYLADKYSADYILTASKPILNLKRVYKDRKYAVYKVQLLDNDTDEN